MRSIFIIIFRKVHISVLWYWLIREKHPCMILKASSIFAVNILSKTEKNSQSYSILLTVFKWYQTGPTLAAYCACGTITSNHLQLNFFKTFSTFVHFCPNFKVFCPFSTFFFFFFLLLFFGKIAPMLFLSIICLIKVKILINSWHFWWFSGFAFCCSSIGHAQF